MSTAEELKPETMTFKHAQLSATDALSIRRAHVKRFPEAVPSVDEHGPSAGRGVKVGGSALLRDGPVHKEGILQDRTVHEEGTSGEEEGRSPSEHLGG